MQNHTVMCMHEEKVRSGEDINIKQWVDGTLYDSDSPRVSRGEESQNVSVNFKPHCSFLFFIHLKLELLTSASDDENILIFFKNRHMPTFAKLIDAINLVSTIH